MVYLRWFLLWCPMVFIMILNAIIRENVYGPYVNELTAHQISTLTGCIIIGFYIWLITPLLKIRSKQASIHTGIFWLFLTVAFEFGFGHFIMHHSLMKLLNDYALWHGRVWVLFLLWFTVLPYLIYRYRTGKPGK